jgi:hypothetical protein
VRATSFAGTSATCSLSAKSRCANGRPAQLLPSTAQTLSGHAATCLSIAAYPALSVLNRPAASNCLVVVGDLDGHRQLVGIDPDEHLAPALALPREPMEIREAGTATTSWTVPSGATPRHGARRVRKPIESHTH